MISDSERAGVEYKGVNPTGTVSSEGVLETFSTTSDSSGVGGTGSDRSSPFKSLSKFSYFSTFSLSSLICPCNEKTVMRSFEITSFWLRDETKSGSLSFSGSLILSDLSKVMARRGGKV
ncbi:hypothetical protein OGAPHI_000918 [Ogataea philodendri]|uniref:Uncharacterized protein n=1 Tax=Ogataea philodendri TaxID=1378263 RepID=A0A9P8PDS8_9ASCO|nr:uncharacterized protein OGAPHI_000918 [Ogataea philodendri]KAH3670403.1 hypothetical protein OGAPHI_000918 [Ogataea philodendri]